MCILDSTQSAQTVKMNNRDKQEVHVFKLLRNCCVNGVTASQVGQSYSAFFDIGVFNKVIFMGDSLVTHWIRSIFQLFFFFLGWGSRADVYSIFDCYIL